MQKYTETTHRSIAWLKKADAELRLEMTPPFQRNPVWSIKQQSSLLETILLEYPIPEIYMQDIVGEDGSEKHVVVDGQQRIRAVLDYIAGDFSIDDDNSRWNGLSFDDLIGDDKKKIFEYKFVVRILPSMPNEQIRSIFQRINRNTVVLNAQELRHATYWGEFIKLMEEIADLEQWNEFGIFSANDRRRMLDAEYISEIAVAYLNGLQNKKTKLEDYYQLYETEFERKEEIKVLFHVVLGEINQILPFLNLTRFKKKSDFYTLFLVLAGYRARMPFSEDARAKLAHAVTDFSVQVDSALRSGPLDASAVVNDYVRGVERAASDLGARRARHLALLAVCVEAIGQPTHTINQPTQFDLEDAIEFADREAEAAAEMEATLTALD